MKKILAIALVTFLLNRKRKRKAKKDYIDV